MKIECIKKIVDINKIHYAIDKFRCEYIDKPSYIIMNYETKAFLMDNHYYYYSIMECNKGNIKREDRLFNIPIAINEGLKFGEVDIV